MFRIFAISFFTSFVIILQGQDLRYHERVFDSIQVEENIIYGKARAYKDREEDSLKALMLDFYQPKGDSLSSRPLVIMIHGGAFLFDQKPFRKDIKVWCDSLAHYGYAAASVYYRTGYNGLSKGSIIRAGYRAVQDIRAAIRFFKFHHQQFGIDTTRIYVGGNSSGAIAALHAAFVDENERPPASYGIKKKIDADDLSCLDCSGNNYNNKVDVKGVISLWGAVWNKEVIDNDEQIPVLMIHGTADGVVPYNEGKAFGLMWYPKLYGTTTIAKRMDSLGIDYEYYLFPGLMHTFYHKQISFQFPNKEWEEVWKLGKNFLSRLVYQSMGRRRQRYPLPSP